MSTSGDSGGGNQRPSGKHSPTASASSGTSKSASNRNNTKNAANNASWNDGEAVECLICAEPVEAFCVFSCGHHTCYSCGLRIHTLNEGGCPVCRIKGGQPPIITRVISHDEEHYSSEEMSGIRTTVITDRKLKCVIDGDDLAGEMAKLYEFVCPLAGCWRRGSQMPFDEFRMLKDHLETDHHLSYCDICVEHRTAFLCEQSLYGSEALRQHHNGQCLQDSSSFTGHPPCKFCSKGNNTRRFYDGEALLKHMQQDHFTCDVCNRGQFTFTFYENRHKLNQHFERTHKICDHPDCRGLDLLLRVFADDFDLAFHRQRAHGIKARVVLGAVGAAATTSSAAAPSSGGGSGRDPVTGSNANVIQVTFDHVHRRETVEMLPTKSMQSTRHNRRRRQPPASRIGAKEMVHAPTENGLPACFHNPGVLQRLFRPVPAAADDGVKGDTGAGAGSSGSGGGGGGGVQPASRRHADPASPVAAPGTHAFGISESMESYNTKNRVPSDPREQERLLNEIVARELASPVAYARFRGCTKEFIDSKMMTSVYYDTLAKEIFPTPAVFHEVFPLLVATVPDPVKRMALQEVAKMRTAPEQQRLARARAEDERAQAEAAEVAQQKARWDELTRSRPAHNVARISTGKQQQQQHKKGGRGGSGGNAWMNPNKVSALQRTAGSGGGGGASATTTPPPQQQQQQQQRSVWGGGAAPASAAPMSAAGASEELYPALPASPIRQSLYAQKKPAPKANAWFKK